MKQYILKYVCVVLFFMMGSMVHAQSIEAVANFFWRFSDSGWGASASGIVNNMEVKGKTDGTALEISTLKTAKEASDGNQFTAEMKFGGKSSEQQRWLHVKVVKGTEVTVYFRRSGNSDARNLVIFEGSYGSSTATRVSTTEGESSAIYMGTHVVTTAADETDIYIGCEGNGLNVYGVRVTAAAEQLLEPVSIYFDDEMTTSIEVGKSITNAAIVEPAVSPVAYTSSNVSVATVTNDGMVTGVAPGTATITASFAGNSSYEAASDYYTITVTEAAQPSELTAVANYVWTFNNWDEETFTENIVRDNLEIGASSSKNVQINSKSGAADNIAFTKIAKLGGAGSTAGRYIHVKVESGTKVTAYATTGKNGTERTLNIATGSLDNVVASFSSSSTSSISSGTVECEHSTDVYFYSAGSGIDFYGVKVEKSGTSDTETPEDETTTTPAETGVTLNDQVNNTTQQNSAVNQLRVELANGNINYYNTADVTEVFADKELGTVTVSMANGESDIYYATVSNLSFAKAVEEEQGGSLSGTLAITEAKGWYESAYVKFAPVSGATAYNVYVKGGQYSTYTKIDNELVRNYGSFGRADAVGLKAGNYSMKVVAVRDGVETATYGEATGLTVKNYRREGFAHKDYQGVGAYNDDGSLKQGARVLYVTKQTAKTVSCDIVTSSSGATTTYTGLQAILGGYEKGYDHTPTAIRIIGTIDKDDLDGMGSSAEGIQVKGKAYTEINLTIEGIGDDATTRGFGFLVRQVSSVEFRNFANMLCLDDALSLDTKNSHVWIHHMDFFYGSTGGDADQAKGDGTVDMKGNSQYITVDHCHFWDSGKSSLCGMKSESGPNYISYHHNWFDHSDSRHPRIRTMSVHVWNNYFDGNSKYGVGACMGSSAFVDRNYFRNCKYPMLISMQGSDIKGGKGTFSSENGGMIKSFGNVLTGKSASNYVPHTTNSTEFDAFEATTAAQQVPATYKAKQGGTTYDNFDTNSSLMYSYMPDSAADVPSLVTGYWGAGRLNHGDFKWSFDNSSEDDNYGVVSELKSALSSYTTELRGSF